MTARGSPEGGGRNVPRQQPPRRRWSSVAVCCSKRGGTLRSVGSPSASQEEVLGRPPARVGLQGHATEEAEDATATTAPDLVPDEVGRQRRRERDAQRQPHAHPSGPGQRSDTQQDGHGGDRQTDLLGGYEREQERVAVLEDELQEIVHVDERRS